MDVTFFCDEENVKFDREQGIWEDTGYDYYSFAEKRRKPIYYQFFGANDPNTKPGALGSYSTHGMFNHIDVASD